MYPKCAAGLEPMNDNPKRLKEAEEKKKWDFKKRWRPKKTKSGLKLEAWQNALKSSGQTSSNREGHRALYNAPKNFRCNEAVLGSTALPIIPEPKIL